MQLDTSCSLRSWVRRILHLVAVVADTRIRVEDIHLVNRIWVYANKASISLEDCWLIFEIIRKDERTLERLLRTATLFTMLSIAKENPSQLEWSRLVDIVFPSASCNLEQRECYRQRLIALCPIYILYIWNEYRWEMDTAQRIFLLLDILEREDFRLVLKQLLVQVSGSNKVERENVIEPVVFVMKTKHWLGNALQLQVNQFSDEKRSSYLTIIAFWKLAIWSPQYTLYQICNAAVLRKEEMSKYLSLVRELDQVASFEFESDAPCLLIQWLQQTLQIAVEEECCRLAWIPSQVSVEALCLWTSLLMQGTNPLVNPLHYIYYVLVPLPVVEKWISQRMYNKLDIIMTLLEIVEKVLPDYYRNHIEMVEWDLYCEDKEMEFRFSAENTIFEWLLEIYEKRWLMPFSLRGKLVDFMYTFVQLLRKGQSDLKEYWDRWFNQTTCYSTRVLLCCLHSRISGVKLQIPFTFDITNHSFGWNTLAYLYLRELVTIGEISVDMGREALLSFYTMASRSQDTVETELLQVNVPVPITQLICSWENSEHLWQLVFLQKLIYLSSFELECLALGILKCAVDWNIWRDSIKPWIKHIYDANPSLLSSREDVVSYITIGKFFLRLLPCYYRIDETVLLTCKGWIEKKYALQMVSNLIQTFQGKGDIQVTSSQICFAFEMLVEASEMYSHWMDEEIVSEKHGDTIELWDMLLLGLSTSILHSGMGNTFIVPFLQHSSISNKLKEQLQTLLETAKVY